MSNVIQEMDFSKRIKERAKNALKNNLLRNLENIPNELKTIPHWICWDFEERINKKGELVKTKVPKNPHTNKYNASVADSTTWGSFEEALVAIGQYDYEGVGFVFTKDIPYFGVDLDKCLENKSFIDEFVLSLGSYNELSPSNNGIHILCKGVKPDGRNRRESTKVEMYGEGRFFTMTGNLYNEEYTQLVDCTETIKPLFEKYLNQKAKAINIHTKQQVTLVSNEELIESLCKDSKFKTLFDGDLTAYQNDESSADAALAMLLVNEIGAKPERIKTLMEMSALKRPKWDEARGNSTYLEQEIIEKAINDFDKSKAKKSRRRLTISILRETLESRNITVKFNMIHKQLDFMHLDDGELIDNISLERLTTQLHDQLYDNHSNCSMSVIERYLGEIFAGNRYNPVLEIIDGTEYDGSDQLSKVYAALNLPESDTLSRVLIKKWLWQALSLLRNNKKNSFETEGILVLQGKRQGTGKTTFCRILSQVDKENLHKYFSGGRELNFGDKDTLRRCLSNFIVELGELDNTMKQEQGKIKAFITQDCDMYRVPYGRADVVELRYTSLCATVNPKGYLLDPTGSRRFWTIPIDDKLGINHNIANSINIVQLYKQIDVEASKNPYGYKLLKSEQQALYDRNVNFDKPIKAEDEIRDVLALVERNPSIYTYKKMTVTSWKNQYAELNKYSAEQVGKVLTKLGIEPLGKPERNADGKKERLRLLPHRFGNDTHN